MSTRHFLEEQLDALVRRHNKAITDAMPVEARWDNYFEKANILRKSFLARSISTSLLILAITLGVDLVTDLDAAVVWFTGFGVIVLNSLAWDFLWKKPRFEAMMTEGVEAFESARLTLHTVRRYDWASTRILNHLQRIALFLDYCNLYSVILDGKPPVVGMTSGGDDLVSFVKSKDGEDGVSRVDMVSSTIRYLKEEIQEHHETFALADRRMLPGVWNLRDAQEFMETFFQCQADLSRRVGGLQELNRSLAGLEGHDSVTPMVNPNDQKMKVSKEIADDFIRLAEVVEPIFSKATPIAVDDKRSEEVFTQAQTQIEAIGAA